MSVVTQVILCFSLLEDERSIMADIDEFPFYRWRAVMARPDAEEPSALSQPVFAASFNHLDVDALKNHLGGLPWEHSEDVQLLLCGEEETRFTLWELLWEYAQLAPGQTGQHGQLWLFQSRRLWVRAAPSG